MCLGYLRRARTPQSSSRNARNAGHRSIKTLRLPAWDRFYHLVTKRRSTAHFPMKLTGSSLSSLRVWARCGPAWRHPTWPLGLFSKYPSLSAGRGHVELTDRHRDHPECQASKPQRVGSAAGLCGTCIRPQPGSDAQQQPARTPRCRRDPRTPAAFSRVTRHARLAIHLSSIPALLRRKVGKAGNNPPRRYLL